MNAPKAYERYNAKRRARVRKLHEQGIPVLMIAKAMGISRQRVYQILESKA